MTQFHITPCIKLAAVLPKQFIFFLYHAFRFLLKHLTLNSIMAGPL